MVAEEPVPPNLLAQLLEVPIATVEPICDAARRRVRQRGTRLHPGSRVAGGYRFQSHPDLAPYVERFVLEGQSARLSTAALETLAIIAYKQPISPRAGRVDPRRRRRSGRAHAAAAGLHRADWPRSRARARRCCAARPRCSSRSSASMPSTTFRLSESSSRAPTSSRRSRRRCGLRAPMSRQPPPDPTADAADPEDHAGTGDRLQKVLAQRGLGSRRACEELIADGPGHRQRRSRRSSAGASRCSPTSSRSTARRSPCGRASSTTC